MVELFKSTANSNFIELTICRVFSDPVTYVHCIVYVGLAQARPNDGTKVAHLIMNSDIRGYYDNNSSQYWIAFYFV